MILFYTPVSDVAAFYPNDPNTPFFPDNETLDFGIDYPLELEPTIPALFNYQDLGS